jgi:hypothetical protein
MLLLARAGIQFALKYGLACDGIKVIVVTGMDRAAADQQPNVTVENLGG